MKKFLAVFLCMVMICVMIPSFFASAESAVAPVTGTVDNTLKGLPEVLGTLYTFITKGFQTLIGSEAFKYFQKAFTFSSIQDFFGSIGNIWNDVMR